MIYKNLICLSCCKLKSQHDNVLYTNRTSTRLQCIKSVHNEILSSEITKINLNRKFLLWRLISDVSIDDIVFERGGGRSEITFWWEVDRLFWFSGRFCRSASLDTGDPSFWVKIAADLFYSVNKDKVIALIQLDSYLKLRFFVFLLALLYFFDIYVVDGCILICLLFGHDAIWFLWLNGIFWRRIDGLISVSIHDCLWIRPSSNLH